MPRRCHGPGYACGRAQMPHQPRAHCRRRVGTGGTQHHALHTVSTMDIEERGKQRCGRNHGLLPPLLLFPHREGRRAIPHGTGSSTHKKTPTWNGRGRHIHAAAPFPRKDVSAPCRAGLLARGMSLLSAPSQGPAPQWSLQISFRSQLRGSDGFAPSSLVTVADCNQPYQRHIQFCRGAYGSTLGFVKDISGGIKDYLHNPSPSQSMCQASLEIAGLSLRL